MSFPSSVPSYAGFTSSHTLSQDNHASQHNSEQADIVALATKVGTGSSTPSNNTVLRGNGTGSTTYDQVHLATDVSGVLPASNGGTGLTSATALNLQVLEVVYPVGCIYTETTGTNPATTFGFGTWSQTGQGRVLVGAGTSDQAFTAGTTGGESNHSLTTAELASHNHGITDPGHTHPITLSNSTTPDFTAVKRVANDSSGNLSSVSNTTGITINNTGSGTAHNNLQPYQVVYFWTRTA